MEKGGFASIIGLSGSGKSTLQHILGGVDKTTSGKVFIEGTDVRYLNEGKQAVFRHRQIGNSSEHTQKRACADVHRAGSFLLLSIFSRRFCCSLYRYNPIRHFRNFFSITPQAFKDSLIIAVVYSGHQRESAPFGNTNERTNQGYVFPHTEKGS